MEQYVYPLIGIPLIFICTTLGFIIMLALDCIQF